MYAVAAGLLMGLLASGPVMAQAPAAAPSPASADPFVDVYTAILDATDYRQMLDLSAIAHAQRAIAADPALAKIEDAEPGLTSDLADALRPVLASQALRLRETYRLRTIAAVRETFTAAEAADIVAFIRTPVGRKLIGGINSAYQSKAIIAIALRLGMITPEDAKSGGEEAARDAFAAMTADDYERLGLAAEQRPALQKLNLFGQRLGALRVAMEEEVLTPSEKTEAQAALKAGLAAHAERFRK